MHAINDVSSLMKTGSYWIAPDSRKIVQSNDDKVSKRSYFSFYYILRALKNSLFPNIWMLIRESDIGYFARNNILSAIDASPDEWEGFRSNYLGLDELKAKTKDNFYPALLSFVQVSRSFGIEPVLMTQFNRINLSDESYILLSKEKRVDYKVFNDAYRLANKTVAKVAEEENVLLIDLASEIEPLSDYMYDVVHLNNAGSEKVAMIIAKKLADSFPDYFKLKSVSEDGRAAISPKL